MLRVTMLMRRGLPVAGATLAILGLPQVANAQPTPDSLRNESVLDLPRAGYEPRNVVLGNIMIVPELDFSTTYDSNIYAAHTNRQADAVFSVQPSLAFRKNSGRLQWRADAFGELRRYASTPRENSETYGVTGTATFTGSDSISLSGTAGYRRAVENRSDPEVRQNPTLGPPLFDVLNGQLSLRIGRNKLGVSLKGEVEKYDFLSSINDDRDFTSYRGTLRVLYRFGPAVNGFVQGYVNQRDFRIRDPISGVNRDGRTLGSLVGVEIDPGGKIRGDIGAGVFHYDPADSSLNGFTGFALQGSLTYVPRARTALILDLFSGDVATVRSGASGRVDRRAHLTVQQEIRHNLVGSLGLGVRQTHYRGVDQNLTTWGADAEVEYLLSGHFSIGLVGQVAKRTASTINDRFERYRIGVELKARY